MKIQKCHICEKPFFNNPTATGIVIDFDPTACPQCNEEARKNSQPPCLQCNEEARKNWQLPINDSSVWFIIHYQGGMIIKYECIKNMEHPSWTYTIDKETNAEYISLSNGIGRGIVHKTKKLRENLLVDLDEDGNVIGIEILD